MTIGNGKVYIIHGNVFIEEGFAIHFHANNPLGFGRFICKTSTLIRTVLKHGFKLFVLFDQESVLFHQRLTFVGIETNLNIFDHIDQFGVIQHGRIGRRLFLFRLVHRFQVNRERRILRIFRQTQNFLNTRHTARDIGFARHTTQVKRVECQLCSRFTQTLTRNHSHHFTGVHNGLLVLERNRFEQNDERLSVESFRHQEFLRR